MDRVQEAGYLKCDTPLSEFYRKFILLTAADQGGNVATYIVRGGNQIYLVPYRVSSLPL